MKQYGAENIKWWKFYEDDDVDFGYKVCLKDGSKHIVEINNDRVDEINEAVNPADLTDCPECGGPVFDSKRGVCTKCSYRESLTEDRKTQYVICGVTNEGTRMLYDAVNDNFTTDYDSATKYDDMDVARDDWFKIPRSGFRRIFIPIYDPAVFEAVNEAESEEPIYFDPDDEFEVDFRYYVYANNDDVVSDAFDFEEDAIAWAQENNYPIVKIHNYYRDTDGELNPDGDPEVVWEA